MKYKQFRIPLGTLQRTVTALKECKEIHDEQNAIIGSLPLNDDYIKANSGTEGLKRKYAIIEECKAKKQIATDITKKIINEQFQAYKDNLKAQTTIKAEDLEHDDYKLLQEGIILSAEELEAIYEKHEGSLAFMNAIEKYASENGWDGFDYSTGIKNIQELGENFFNGALQGSENTNNYHAMRIMDEGEPKRLAMEYHVASEYFASGGE